MLSFIDAGSVPGITQIVTTQHTADGSVSVFAVTGLVNKMYPPWKRSTDLLVTDHGEVYSWGQGAALSQGVLGYTLDKAAAAATAMSAPKRVDL